MPYVITTKTPPTTGDMACCHSTIGAGKCGHMVEQSRRAVATLDEARTAAAAVILARYGHPMDAETARWLAAGLPESGGTVGPLPDGTVIEVRPANHAELRTAYPDDPAHDHWDAGPAILDAYNAAQEAGR